MGKKFRHTQQISLIILVTFCLSLPALSQNESYRKPFNTKRKPGIMRFYTLFAPTETSAEKFDRFNTDFFYNSWIGDVNGVKTQFYSLGHNVNIMYDLPFSKTSRFGVAVGLGFSHFSVRHQGELSIHYDPNSGEEYTNLSPLQTDDHWVNRSVFNFVEVPFELRIRSRTERPKFKFYPGFKVGYLGGMYHKWRIGSLKYKEFNYVDQQKLHYGPTLKLGVNNLMLFGYYDMTVLFDNPSSSQLQVFALGISIGWF